MCAFTMVYMKVFSIILSLGANERILLKQSIIRCTVLTLFVPTYGETWVEFWYFMANIQISSTFETVIICITLLRALD